MASDLNDNEIVDTSPVFLLGTCCFPRKIAQVCSKTVE